MIASSKGKRNSGVTVDGKALAGASEAAGSGFRINAGGTADGPTLEGHYSLIKLRPGLIVHASDAVELRDLSTEIIQRPGLTVSLVLSGEIVFTLGGRPFSLSAEGPGGETVPAGHLLHRAEPEHFVRQLRRGRHVRKVNVTVGDAWLDEVDPSHRLLPQAMRAHLAHHSWQPSSQAVQLAEQILNPPVMEEPALARLYLENRATGLLLEALASLGGARLPLPVSPHAQRQVEEACRILAANPNGSVGLAEVARAVGASVSTLQRLFHAVHGTSIGGYVRAERLLGARLALESGSLTIAEAARRAGYASPANFATAFRRRFGVSPRQIARLAKA